MRFDEVFHDREAEPGAAGFAGASAVGAVKSFENSRKVFRGDSTSRIAHDKLDATSLTGGLNSNSATIASMSQRVLDEVHKYLLECRSIGVYDFRVRLDISLQQHAFGFGGPPETLEDFTREIRNAYLLRQRLPVARFDARKVQQLVDNALHPLSIAENRSCEIGALIGWDVWILE
ncbi:MAG TPA: hypothetical protein VIG78_09215, partial [Gemmatimonadaceae bacterium]